MRRLLPSFLVDRPIRCRVRFNVYSVRLLVSGQDCSSASGNERRLIH